MYPLAAPVLLLSAVFTCSSLASEIRLVYNFAEHLTEAQVAGFLDAIADPPPRSCCFDELVPQENILLQCVRPGGSQFQPVSAYDGARYIREHVDLSLPITIITHGWTEGTNGTLYQQMAARFRRFVPGANVCLLDWRPYATFCYEISARRGIPLVVQQLTSFLRHLVELGLTLQQVSLVGFSMGGQIVGLTGKNFGGQIGAIYALDPAGPLFTTPHDVGPDRRLASTDARYVQMIATSRGLLGVEPLLGTQNFLPNGGYHPQGPCLSLTVTRGEILGVHCSHEYAVHLFSISLDPAIEIRGRKCYENGLDLLCCHPRLHDRLGFHARRFRGNFCL